MKRATTAYHDIRVREAVPGEPALEILRSLYLDSFPPDERRDWCDILRRIADDTQPLRMLVIECSGVVAGFVTLWRLTPRLTYIEHLVVDAALRGNGVGAAVIRILADLSDSSLVLEAELPDAGAMAQRRIRFYERNGFVANSHFPYIQPPYGPGLSEVPLVLMTRGHVDLDEAAACIRREVYGAP